MLDGCHGNVKGERGDHRGNNEVVERFEILWSTAAVGLT